MKINIYSLFDSKLQVYRFPFAAINKGHAVRMLQDFMVEQQPDVKKHPSDFTLFETGAYDDSTGIVDSYQAHDRVGGVHELLGEQEANPTAPDLADPIRRVQ